MVIPWVSHIIVEIPKIKYECKNIHFDIDPVTTDSKEEIVVILYYYKTLALYEFQFTTIY